MKVMIPKSKIERYLAIVGYQEFIKEWFNLYDEYFNEHFCPDKKVIQNVWYLTIDGFIQKLIDNKLEVFDNTSFIEIRDMLQEFVERLNNIINTIDDE